MSGKNPNPKIKEGIEIERKFLVSALPKSISKAQHYEVIQAYLKITPDEEVRIRKAFGAQTNRMGTSAQSRQEGCSITTKRGKGMSRYEDIEVIDDGQFERLFQKAEGKTIEKTRYEIPYGGHTIELDIYRGELEGLRVAEIEFESEKESMGFKPPKWFGEEVTENERYKNKNLSKFGMPK
jgi:adenylate cyclase